MSLTEDIIFSDPVLQRVFFDEQLFAPMPGKTADVNLLLARITEQKLRLMKARTIAAAETIQLGTVFRMKTRDKTKDGKPKYRWARSRGLRELYFAVRVLCDGYRLELPRQYDDGCQHVVMFAHGVHDECFDPDWNVRAALWHQYAQRRPERTRGARWY